MRPLDEDYEDQDEFEFDHFAASGRLLRDKHHHHKLAGRKLRKHGRRQRWENDSLDPAYEYEDYDELEFDRSSGFRLND